MKLDIANHQLRMLRPFLLESAAEFEFKTFCENAEMACNKPEAVERTQKWLTMAEKNATTSTFANGNVRVSPTIRDGILQLLFHPECLANPTLSGTLLPPTHSASRTAAAISVSRVTRRQRAIPLLSSSQLPETLQLDAQRMQILHSEVVDLSVVSLLMLLYRQLRSMKGLATPSAEQAEQTRREVWLLVNENNVGLAQCKATVPTSIKKLESLAWKEGMRAVLLQIARRAHDSADSPSQETLNMLNSWMENNIKADSKLVSISNACTVPHG